jgi:hypothetical protein
MTWDTDADLQRLIDRFEASTIAASEWTHRAHLAAAAWYVHKFGTAAAVDKMRTGLLNLNAQHGTPNTDTRGYHETITRAYVTLIADVLGDAGAASPRDAAQAVLNSPVAVRDVLRRYYSDARLMSVEARRGWVEPDLHPLPIDHSTSI